MNTEEEIFGLIASANELHDNGKELNANFQQALQNFNESLVAAITGQVQTDVKNITAESVDAISQSIKEMRAAAREAETIHKSIGKMEEVFKNFAYQTPGVIAKRLEGEITSAAANATSGVKEGIESQMRDYLEALGKCESAAEKLKNTFGRLWIQPFLISAFTSAILFGMVVYGGTVSLRDYKASLNRDIQALEQDAEFWEKSIENNKKKMWGISHVMKGEAPYLLIDPDREYDVTLGKTEKDKEGRQLVEIIVEKK